MGEVQKDDRYAMMVCPFDENHYIEVFIAAKHIMKCKRNFPNHKKVVCPFNATHWVEKTEYRDHLRRCTDRGRIEAEAKYEQELQAQHKQVGYLKESLYGKKEFVVPDTDENWEDEAICVTRHLTVSHREKVKRGANFRETGEEYFADSYPLQHVQEPPLRPPKVAPQVLQVQQKASRNEPPLRLPKEAPQVLQVQQTASRNDSQDSKLTHPRMENVEALRALSLGRGVGRGVLLTPHTGRGGGRGVMVVSQEKRQIPNGLQGLGRGRGTRLVKETDLPSSNQQDDSAYGSTSDSDIGDTEKHQKKLSKKLREIKSLEAKQREGKVLNPDQLKKVASKAQLEMQLKNCVSKKSL